MHIVDLSNKDIRCDLISDLDINIFKEKEMIGNILVERTNVISSKINKRKGKYTTIFFKDATDIDNREIIEQVFIKELKRIINDNVLNKSILIVGLGNSLSTPDSLGPKTIDNIIPTRHLYLINKLDKNYSIVSKIAPGVFATTGIETFDIIKGTVKQTNPDYIFVIDALSTNDVEKVNKVIQITDSGIDPGSGVGNQRKELSKKTLGKKVIAIGVPTVVNLHSIVKKFLNEYDVDPILKEKGNDYLVTPKEIDFEVDKLSILLAKSINKTLHNVTK